MSDSRIVYGARCVWWDSVDKVATHASGLPCCPHCGSVLYEAPNEAHWWAGVDQYDASHPGYRAFIEWLRGRCYPTHDAAREAYEAELSGGQR